MNMDTESPQSDFVPNCGELWVMVKDFQFYFHRMKTSDEKKSKSAKVTFFYNYTCNNFYCSKSLLSLWI